MVFYQLFLINRIIIINRKVYDVTKFVKLHPGGKQVLTAVAGKDCTKELYALH